MNQHVAERCWTATVLKKPVVGPPRTPPRPFMSCPVQLRCPMPSFQGANALDLVGGQPGLGEDAARSPPMESEVFSMES